jgi:dihydroorotate dehydrogenase (fumarate)
MDLSTTYLGFTLPHPLMPGASPLVDDLDTVRQLEDAGAAAIVMHSLFEEQIELEAVATVAQAETHAHAFGEALSFLPPLESFMLGADDYLEQIRRIKAAVHVPVIASLNGASAGGWLRYAELMEQAGADALELNVYLLASDPSQSAQAVEERTLDLVSAVKAAVDIPVAVKLSPFYTAFAHFAVQLDALGPAGIILFNRFYQPGIDIEALEVQRSLHLSDPSELPLRLRWLAILSSRVRASLAVTGGVHGVEEVVQSVMAGAHAVQMVSALLKNGPRHLAVLRQALSEWLEQHEYDSLRQMQGSMNLATCPDPQAYERANYMMMLQSWRR